MSKKKLQKDADQEAVMGVVDHIREFRNRLIVIAVIFVAAVIIGFYYAAPLIDILKVPSADLYNFVYLGPQELLLQYVRVSVVAALVVTAPVILYELLAFASPGLKPSEKSFVMAILMLGLLFFVLGVIFAYTILLPFMLKFFDTIGMESGVEAQISIEKYVSLMISIMGVMGLVFEMPVLTILLTQMGFLKPEWLKKSRRVVVVVIFIVAAIITPPDVVSQVMVAIPMLGLFQISIVFSSMVRKRKDKKRAKREAEENRFRYQ
ncbi:MAG: twin-arginine translocase subunit TatC [Lachnospiraceae bacterium]|nr:twin-arginine translocase subunit TatC [Lachnospiraceae bacterium]